MGDEGTDATDPDATRGPSARASADADGGTTLLGHFYRAEMDRVNTWRGRLDRTTNWAVTIMAAVLTWTFASADNPHYVILIGTAAVAMFHVVETRRYRAYDVWRARVRLLEEDLLAPAINPDRGAEHEDWRAELAEDLRRPALKTSFGEAYARRLRRIYLPLFAVLVAAWVVRITVFAPGERALETAGVVGVPGAVVVGVVAVASLAAVAVAFWPRGRHSTGEFHERTREGEWKDE